VYEHSSSAPLHFPMDPSISTVSSSCTLYFVDESIGVSASSEVNINVNASKINNQSSI